MHVLFEFSRGALDQYQENISLIRGVILKDGHTLTNDLLGSLQKSGPKGDIPPEEAHAHLQTALEKAQCVILEGSIIGLSHGYVLTEAINLGKPVLFLVNSKSVSQPNRFVASINSKLLTYSEYASDEELISVITNFLSTHDLIRTRFNLVLPNRLNSYITIQSMKRGTSKTDYILKLIEKDLQENN